MLIGTFVQNGSATPGNINFKGQDYMFYHNGLLPNGGGFHRSTAIEEFKFNEDGSIPFIPFTTEGVKPVGTLNPYNTVKAETMAQSHGLKTDRNAGTEHYVTNIHNGDWIRVRSVDLGSSSPERVSVKVLNSMEGGRIEFYLDEMSGSAIATAKIQSGYASSTVSVPVSTKATGVHDIYILFRGGDKELFEFDSWKMDK